MKAWVCVAIFAVIIGIIDRAFIADPPVERLETHLYQSNLDMKVGKVLTESGKLQFSGYLSSPTLQWDPTPLLQSFFSRMRYKQWDFYAIYSDDLTLCVAIADLGYVKNVFITVYDPSSDPITYEKLVMPWEPTKMSSTSEIGTSAYNSSDFFVQFHSFTPDLRSVVAKHRDIDINLQFRKSHDQEGMVYLGPMNSDKSQFFYSHKQYNFKVDGYVMIGANEYLFNKELGVMDWGRGVWPYHGGWIWASGMGRYQSNEISINIGELPKDRQVADASDDCVFLNQTMIKLGIVNMKRTGELTDVWEFYTINKQATSRYAAIRGSFTPEKLYSKNINFWLIKSQLNQLFGIFRGEVSTVDGSFKFKIRGLLEVHESRW